MAYNIKMILHEKTQQEFNCTFETAKATDRVYVQCDYCGKHFTRRKTHIIQLNQTINKDSCGAKSCTVKKRSESTIHKHGVDCFKEQFLEKAQATSLEKYGVKNPAQSEHVKQKIKETNLERYGVEYTMQNAKVRAKRKVACFEKYGVEYPTQTESVKQKSRETCQEKYGVSHHQQTKEWKEKIKDVCQEKYQVDSVMQVPEFKKRQEESLFQKYGVTSPLRSDVLKKKAEETCIERYGVKNYASTEEYRIKYTATCIKRYGKSHPMSNTEVKSRSLENRLEKYGTLIPNLGKTQKTMQEWLNSLGNFKFNPDLTILKEKEIDLYEPTLKIGVEYCGLYWHNEISPEPRGRSYHYNKFLQCNKLGVKLFTIFEDEWLNHESKCKNIIKSALGVFDNRIYARNCKFVEVSKNEANNFLDSYHLLGSSVSIRYNFGLKFENELVGLISLGKHHRKLSDINVISRVCFCHGIQVVGGMSKMLKGCVDSGFKGLITWSDNRWSSGNMYLKSGFKLEAELPPDYSYVYKKTRISKQSQKKSNTGCPSETTEREWALQHGLARIWDCGKKRWVFNDS